MSRSVAHNAACIALALALAAPGPNLAQQADTELPLNVEADRAELNEATGIGVYRGDVRITQGSMLLKADTVTVIAPERRLQKVIAEGDRSTFRQTTASGQVLWAEASRMEYEPLEDRITLLGEAVLRRAENRFAAERIVYHIERQVVDADDPEGAGRVKMTLVPEDEDGGGGSPDTR
jgi:lipopolysaccharide export system protein LptA